MKKQEEKRVTVYSKNGNTLEIKASLKGAFVGKGYTLEKPKTEENV